MDVPLHEMPPGLSMAAQTVTGAPPAMATVLIWPGCQYAIERPSGENTMLVRLPALTTALAATSDIARTYTLLLATYASRVPSGDTAIAGRPRLVKV